MIRRLPPFLFIAPAALLAACDVGPVQHQPLDTPPMHLVEVLGTTGVEGGVPQHTRLSEKGTSKVLTTSSFVLRFDRFLDWRTAIRQSICLQPLTDRVEKLEDCRAGVFLEPTYDPVRREVVFRQEGDARLAPGTTYVLTALAPIAQGFWGFLAFDGAPLDRTTAIELSTVDEDPPGATTETATADDLFCEASACESACTPTQPDVKACVATQCDKSDQACADACLLACRKLCPASGRLATCATSGCHAARADETAPGGATFAAMDLDLSSPDSIARTAIAHVAHETQTGEHAREVDEGPRRFGRAMPIVDPGNPGNSYLLYKLLVSPAYAASSAAPDPAEIERLRASIVVGMPMPPAGGQPVDLDALETLSAWIAQGAPVHACK